MAEAGQSRPPPLPEAVELPPPAVDLAALPYEEALGVLANSLALIADASHNLGDVLGLLAGSCLVPDFVCAGTAGGASTAESC